MAESINAAIIERLEKVAYTLQDNSIKVGNLFAVHNDKLDKLDRIEAHLFSKVEEIQKTLDRETSLIKKGCERDIRKVDDRLRIMEKKMWTIFGGLAVISFMVSVPGQALMKRAFLEGQVSQLTDPSPRATLTEPTQDSNGNRRRVRSTDLA